MSEIPKLDDNDYCFGCGSRNPIGLQLQFGWDQNIYFTEWTPLPEHQGWEGVVHGGLIATVFDEVLSRAALERHGLKWMTAELNIRLRKPARVGFTLRVCAELTMVRSKLIISKGVATEVATGREIAAGEAKLIRVQ
jgi:acyl-coenzyme A thioesterase PaaI-like protein